MRTQVSELFVVRGVVAHYDEPLSITFGTAFLKSESTEYLWPVDRRCGEEVFVKAVLQYRKLILSYARLPEFPFAASPRRRKRRMNSRTVVRRTAGLHDEITAG